jgi:PAS domain-containing protein
MITDKSGKIQYVSDYFLSTTGFTREELIGQNPRIFSSGLHNKQFWERVFKHIEQNGEWSGYITNLTKAGTQYEMFEIIFDIGEMYVVVRAPSNNTMRVQTKLFIKDLIYELSQPLTYLVFLSGMLKNNKTVNINDEKEMLVESINRLDLILNNIKSLSL